MSVCVSLSHTEWYPNFPENLQGSSAYNATKECINSLEEALEILASAY